MRTSFFAPIALLLVLFYGSGNRFYKSLYNTHSGDSTIIDHKLDGSVDEWPADKFTDNKDLGLAYAIDNNSENLYVVLNITHPGEQMKVMRMGMSLYIDLKGKKKESRGIEFPIKKENGNNGGYQPQPATNQSQDGQKGSFDFKRMRMMMAINLIHLKQFGFTEGDPIEQDLLKRDEPSIAYNWDSLDVMHIEYMIPMKMLGDASSLNQKMISIGWKINGIDLSSTSENSTGTSMGRGGRGGGGFSGRSGPRNPGNSSSGADREKMMKEPSVWGKYTIR